MAENSVPDYVAFFSAMGAAAAMSFSAIGAAYGTAKSGTGVAASAIMKPDQIMKNTIPVVMAGIIGIYGVVVSVLISNAIIPNLTDGAKDAASRSKAIAKGFAHFGAGLAVGLSGLGAGFAIGIVGDAGVRGTAQQPKLYVGMILILIFAEVLGLYGLIAALLMLYI